MPRQTPVADGSVSRAQGRSVGAIARGYSYDEASRRLGCSPSTVRDHLVSASKRLEAKSVAHLVALATARALIPALPKTGDDQSNVHGSLHPGRLEQIVQLRNQCRSGDRQLLRVHTALDDLLAERERLIALIPRHRVHRPSDRQMDVLLALARGEKRTDVGERMGASPYTITSYVKRARISLGATRVPHAVAIAMANGWITPSEILTAGGTP